jgi:demethylmenaquinone methyltransferase/2-methoxy-6-polyprenyl-1,4-benzoquinol methylase
MQKLYDALFNFLFYLPLGGEASFINKCLRFAELTAGNSVLDVCCGTGKLAVAIAAQGTTVDLVGIDISGPSIETAHLKTRHTSASFLIASAGDLPFESSRFDKCIISFGLHHIPSEIRLRALKEVNRALTPEGNLYIFDYHLPERGLRRLTAVAFTKLDNKGEAFSMLKSGKLVREIEEAGFEIAERALTYHGIIQLLKVVKRRPAK